MSTQYPPPQPAPQQPFQAGVVPVMPAVLTDQQPPNTAVVVISWLVAVATGLYLLPWTIAATRGKSNQWPVFTINLLLGWTLVGWVVALVMATTAHRPLAAMGGILVAPAPLQTFNAPGWYPNPSGQGSSYWNGQNWTGSQR